MCRMVSRIAMAAVMPEKRVSPPTTPIAHSKPKVSAIAPEWRARSLSVYRFWRDLGYAVGALTAGIVADLFGFVWAIASVAALTFLSGLVVAIVMRDPEPT